MQESSSHFSPNTLSSSVHNMKLHDETNPPRNPTQTPSEEIAKEEKQRYCLDANYSATETPLVQLLKEERPRYYLDPNYSQKRRIKLERQRQLQEQSKNLEVRVQEESKVSKPNIAAGNFVDKVHKNEKKKTAHSHRRNQFNRRVTKKAFYDALFLYEKSPKIFTGYNTE